MKLAILVGVLFSTPLFANDLEIPDLEFKPELIEQTKAWAHDAKMEIERGLEVIKRQSIERKEDLYRTLLDDVLNGSRTENESLMRFVLYRAKVVHNVLLETPRDPKRNATARRLLKESLEKAVTLYQTDISVFEQLKNKKEYVRPGEFVIESLNWIEFILNLHYQLPTNKSRLQILKTSLVIWINDIAKDATYNRELAPITDRAGSFYQTFERQPDGTNSQRLKLSRDLRTFIETEVRFARSILDKQRSEREAAIQMQEKLKKEEERKRLEAEGRSNESGYSTTNYLICLRIGKENHSWNPKHTGHMNTCVEVASLGLQDEFFRCLDQLKSAGAKETYSLELTGVCYRLVKEKKVNVQNVNQCVIQGHNRWNWNLQYVDHYLSCEEAEKAKIMNPFLGCLAEAHRVGLKTSDKSVQKRCLRP